MRLVIFDPQGRRIATLAEGERAAGRHFAMWQGRSETGNIAPAGVYLAVLEHEGAARSVRILRLP
jgi:flagellar hook assembly protein FlgD